MKDETLQFRTLRDVHLGTCREPPYNAHSAHLRPCRIAAQLLPAQSTLSTGLLVRLCVALRRLGCSDRAFAAAAAVISATRRVDMDTEELVMATIALAELGGLSGAAAEALEEEVRERAALGAVRGCDAARLACAFALAAAGNAPLYAALRRAAMRSHEPLSPGRLIPLERNGNSRSTSVPAFIINLDRSPERLLAMAEEVHRLNLDAYRFVAFDGRHRVLRHSRAAEEEDADAWLADLPEFRLEWSEPQPTLGLALTGQSERHFIGYVGSFLSHLGAARCLLSEGLPFAVILEDDQVLHPDLGRVVEDIVASAGDRLDVVNLGPLDWRFRTLEYAQRRKP